MYKYDTILYQQVNTVMQYEIYNFNTVLISAYKMYIVH